MSSSQSYSMEPQEKGPPRTIFRKIILLFFLLIAVIIGNAISSSIKETEKVNQQLDQELQAKLVIVESILNNELDKLNMVARIVQEQNRKFVDFLDYDKLNPITFMLQTIAAKHDIDLIFLFDGEDNLLTCNRLGTKFSHPHKYQIFMQGDGQQIRLAEIPSSILMLQNMQDHIHPKIDKILTMQSVVNLLHDSGDIYGHIVMGNWRFAIIKP